MRPAGVNAGGGLCRSPARCLCNSIDVDGGWRLPSILKFARWIVGQLPTAIPIIHWPRHGILRNVNDSGGIQHLGSKGLKESVSCICEQAINPAVCRSDFQLVPPMWSRAALARVANCWCPRVMWCCPEDGALISRPTPPCPAMGGRLGTPSGCRKLAPVKASQSNRSKEHRFDHSSLVK